MHHVRIASIAIVAVMPACATVTDVTVVDAGVGVMGATRDGGDPDGGGDDADSPGAPDDGEEGSTGTVGADAGSSPETYDAGHGRDASNTSPFVGTWSCAAAPYYIGADGGSGMVASTVDVFVANADGTLTQILDAPPSTEGGAPASCSLACVVSGSIAVAASGQSCPVWQVGGSTGALRSATFAIAGAAAAQSVTFTVSSTDGGSESAIYSADCARN